MRLHLLVAVLAVLAVAAPAHAGLLDLPGLAALIAEKAKESKACGLVAVDGTLAGGAYLPVWTFHERYELDATGREVVDSMRDQIEFGVGGTIARGENWRPRAIAAVNIPALSRRFWGGAWARNHLRRSQFPPIWLGPSVTIPLPGDRFRLDNWRTWLGGMLAVGF